MADLTSRASNFERNRRFPMITSRRAPTLWAFAILLVVWTIAAVPMNADRARSDLERSGTPVTMMALLIQGWSMDRPVLPAPHQIAVNLWQSAAHNALTSRRNILYHVSSTVGTAMCGLAAGVVLGFLLAVIMVESRLFEAAMMPWIVVSQTVPTLAVAPIVVVVLGRIGLGPLWQKVVIDAVIVFFPITLAVVRGLRSPEQSVLDLMRSYAASRWHILLHIRIPASIDFLFPALKIAVALSIIATVVSELPTGADSGIGTRLLIGSYNGLMLTVWGALTAISIATAMLIGVVTLIGALLRVEGTRSQ